jgi:predicted  nucleic acid-binding Zn-ribbon protein
MGNASFWLVWRNSANELQTYACGDDELIIGHSQDARLSFPSDAEKEVSIDRLGSDLVLRNTAQGVLLNGAVVTRRTLLEDGDTISLTSGIELRVFTDGAALDEYMTQQMTNAVSESPATEFDLPLKTTPSADSSLEPPSDEDGFSAEHGVLFEASYFDDSPLDTADVSNGAAEQKRPEADAQDSFAPTANKSSSASDGYEDPFRTFQADDALPDTTDSIAEEPDAPALIADAPVELTSDADSPAIDAATETETEEPATANFVDPFQIDDPEPEPAKAEIADPFEMTGLPRAISEPAPAGEPPSTGALIVSPPTDVELIKEMQEAVVILDAEPLVVKRTPRQYCTATFRLLDPQDPDPAYRAIVQCTSCEALYHEVAWRAHKRCLRCGNTRARTVSIPPPAVLQVINKPAAIVDRTKKPLDLTIQPRTRTERAKSEAHQRGRRVPKLSIGAAIRKLGLAWRNNLITVIILVIVAVLAANSFNLLKQARDENTITASMFLDTILDPENPPSSAIILATVGAVLLCAFALFPHELTDGMGHTSSGRRRMRLLAVVVLLGLWNVFLFLRYTEYKAQYETRGPIPIPRYERQDCAEGWDAFTGLPSQAGRAPLQTRMQFQNDELATTIQSGYGVLTPLPCLLQTAIKTADHVPDAPFVVVQLAAILLALIAVPIYRNSARLGNRLIEGNVPGTRLASIIRYVAVVTVCILVGTFLVTLTIQPKLDVYRLTSVSAFGVNLTITFTTVVIVLVLVVFAMVIYVPPQHKTFKRVHPMVRFLVIVAAGLLFASLYTQHSDRIPEHLMNELLGEVIALAVVMGFVLLPVQRALS